MIKVGVIGAGGLVGSRVISILENLPLDFELIPVGKSRSVGKEISFRGKRLNIVPPDLVKLRKLDYCLLTTPTEASRELVPELLGGPILIDTSSAFRMETRVPLVVPEVNAHALAVHRGLIAGPNCAVIQLVIVLKPLLEAFGLNRVLVATYQSVSGIGFEGITRLTREITEIQSGNHLGVYRLAFNVLAKIDSFLPNGYSREEMKMVEETRKILEMPHLPISATCVRVPALVGHSEACWIELDRAASVENVRHVLSTFPGVKIVDDLSTDTYPTPVMAEGQDYVMVGRIRQDISAASRGIWLWIVADNLRRGAATNACNILRILLEQRGELR